MPLLSDSQQHQGSGSTRNELWVLRAQPLINRLAAFEGFDGTSAFVHKGAWLVRPHHIPTLARYWFIPPQRQLPGIRSGTALGLVWRWLSPMAPYVHLPTAADAIQLSEDGKRLRALYLRDRARSIKLTDVTRRQYTHPDREVELRLRVAALGTVRVPRVFSTQTVEGIVVTEEELIFGRRLIVRYDLPFIRDVLVPKLVATYRAAGVTYEPLSSYVPADLPKYLPPGAFQSAVVRLLARRPDVAISFCHGDISPSNIIVVGKDVVIVDWENSGTGIAVLDLLALALRYPHNRALLSILAAAIRSDLSERGASLEELLLLAVAIRIAGQAAS